MLPIYYTIGILTFLICILICILYYIFSFYCEKQYCIESAIGAILLLLISVILHIFVWKK